jgi:beta-glucosidase
MPQWSRTSETLGEDAHVASELCAAAVRGLQGEGGKLGTTSVSACVKHFPGGGPTKEGIDPHFEYGAEQAYPGDGWGYHLRPFRAAVNEGVSVVMPSYGKPVGTKFPEVGMAFNKPVLDILRKDMGFDGVIVSDWAIITEMPHPEVLGDVATPRAWGVEHLNPEERVVAVLDAGIDQIGGEYDVDLLLNIVRDGRVSESRIDESVRRLLKNKFDLGLFDNPFVDADAADAAVGNKANVAAGFTAQKDSVTLLKNDIHEATGRAVLPLAAHTKLYLEGFEHSIEGLNTVDFPADADVAVVRLKAPWTPMGNGPFARSFHHGSLEFPQDVLDHIQELSETVHVVVEIFADRPAVLGSIATDATAILLSFGLCQQGLVEVLYGHPPRGKLPFDLPRSDAAVKAAKCDTPFDSKNPFYRYGYGLSYV